MTDLVRSKHPGGRPLIYISVEELEKDINAYFADCDAKELPYTMSGLALALGVDRKTIINYSDKEEFFHAIKNARRRVEQYAEQQLFIGKNQTGTIFNLKNNFGWKDEQQLSVQSTNTVTHIVQSLDAKADEYTNKMIDVTAEAQRLTQPVKLELEDVNPQRTDLKVLHEVENVSRETKAKKKAKLKNSKKLKKKA